MDTKESPKWIELDVKDILDIQEIMNSDIFCHHIASDPWLKKQFIPKLKFLIRMNRRISEKQWMRFCKIHEEAHRLHNQRQLILKLRKENKNGPNTQEITNTGS